MIAVANKYEIWHVIFINSDLDGARFSTLHVFMVAGSTVPELVFKWYTELFKRQ